MVGRRRWRCAWNAGEGSACLGGGGEGGQFHPLAGDHCVSLEQPGRGSVPRQGSSQGNQ